VCVFVCVCVCVCVCVFNPKHLSCHFLLNKQANIIPSVQLSNVFCNVRYWMLVTSLLCFASITSNVSTLNALLSQMATFPSVVRIYQSVHHLYAKCWFLLFISFYQCCMGVTRMYLSANYFDASLFCVQNVHLI
jgi:hypothetical protein